MNLLSSMRTFALVSAAAAALLGSAHLQAGSLQGTLNLSITYQNSCSSVSVTQPLAFGNYSNGSTQPLDSALVTVDVVCDAQTGGTVYLDGGQHLDGTTRRMSNGAGQYLSYEVYRGEAGGVSPYGLVIGSGGYVVGVGAGTANINGRIFSGQRVVPGNYSDTLLVTLYW